MKKRIAVLLKSFSKAGIEALWVSSEENVTYLSGFRGSESFLLITPKNRYFLTDFRYLEQARRETEGFKMVLRDTKSYPELLAQIQKREKLKKIGFEAPKTSYAFYSQLAKWVGAENLVSTNGLVESLRIIKDKLEIANLKRAVEITRDGIRHLAATVAPGMSEKEVQSRLEHETKLLGSEKPAFDIIIAAGAKSSMPHAVSDHASKVKQDDMVLVDMGVVYEGYHSDLTRCIFPGKIPRPIRKIYDIVLTAQEKGIHKVKPGVPARDVDAACRDHIHKKGYGRFFGHGTGHGVGLEIHEAPTVSSRSQDILRPGMVVTVEPGIYLAGRFGVRIEDMVLVTDKGYEVLTRDINKRI